MKPVKVSCPKCNQVVQLAHSELDRSDGRAVCHHCLHIFQLVKRKKNHVLSEQKNKQQATVELLDKHHQEQNSSFVEQKQVEKSSHSPRKYRIPKAATKVLRFTQVQAEPLPFNLIDGQQAVTSNQLAVVPTYHGQQSAAMPTLMPEQQNNVTIHTDSLVFTLVNSEGHNPVGQPHASILTMPHAPVSTVATQSENHHWTVATISALIVLILQLFYLIMMLI